MQCTRCCTLCTVAAAQHACDVLRTIKLDKQYARVLTNSVYVQFKDSRLSLHNI